MSEKRTFEVLDLWLCFTVGLAFGCMIMAGIEAFKSTVEIAPPAIETPQGWPLS